MFLNKTVTVALGGIIALTKSGKKAKTAGLEQHRQALRAKKMKKKERKKVELPSKHKKK